ncbi:flagellar motor protein MotB [Rhizobium sp. Leaf371]|uniref:flagellar motor protein MotB n=1 Tax=Rhizobium sp. Leaf371 TaxID=1736355 RepID=UPI0007150AD6|nr:flagellar motor protein MotB [Rhizobium sp. Leaf371]KQS65134.1 flagellar motor protein MotB [Rhizobium sp. Leaf371]
MSESNSHHGKNEIIIIKRHAAAHGGSHGGAWKIAYADFMTAMMAFFLVMWLINASNPKTKAAIASYFNPVQLTQQEPSEKGVKEPAKDAQGEETQARSKVDGNQPKSGGSAKSGEDESATSGEETKYSDADFFENPYSVLSEIASEVGRETNISSKGDGGASTSGPATGASGGEAYRDPFDPDFWAKQVELKKVAETGSAAGDKTGNGAADNVGDGKSEAKGDAMVAANDPATPKPAPSVAETKAASELKEAIEKEIGGAAGKLAEGLLVTPTEGGLLVSISEQSNTPMFGLGSAVPERETVLAMEKIGKLLSTRSGAIAIRGHTDARPFKAGGYDNWRLSADRAQSAYYMLIHGGLAEDRVSQISGFADRRLQVPEDPNAAANRRIEILIQSNQG